ncbi:MAG: tetratricopeptide repeat protein, partial [Planctomycetota bacterium]|nr:tetratricopeptide repeat protein [Planctomycetota bacterium]
ILALFPPFGLMRSSRTEDELDRICRGEFLPPSGRAVPGTVPAELEQVVLKAMALNPEVRYQSVGDLQREIEAFLEGRLLEAVEYGPLERLGKWTRRHRVLVRSVAMILILTVGVFLVLGWKHRGEKRDRFQALISQAEAWSVEIDQLGKGERERRFELYLESAAALDQALGVMPGNSVARALRRRVGKGLGKTAMEGRDFMLAQRAFEDLERFGLSRSEVTRLITSVEEARDRVVVERRDRLLAMLKDIGGGLHRPGRDLGKPGLEDYIYEASGFRDEQTVELLGAQLDRLVQRKKAGGGEWVLKERELAAFACRVLGRIGLPSAVGPLSRWIESLEDVDLILEAAEALGNTRHESAHPAIIKAGSRFYGDSKIHRVFQKVLARVPIPVQKNPRTPADLFHRAVRRQREGNLQGALEDYSLAISRLPTFAMAYGNRGVVRYRMKDVEGALADINAALRLNPSLGGSHRFRGFILREMKRFEEAEKSFTRAIELGQELAISLLARAELRHQTGNQEGALEDANRAEKLAPEDWRIPNLKGAIYHQRGNNKRALDANIRVLHLDPGNKGALRACAFFNWKLGQSERSLEYLEKALSKFPRDLDFLSLRGAIHGERGDLEAAIEDFEQCHQIRPKQIGILKSLVALYRKSKQKRKAVEVFGKLIQLAPERLEYLVDRGGMLESMGEFEQALADFDAVIEKNPKISIAFMNRGIVHMKLNRPREAKADFERSLDLGSVPDQIYLLFGDLLSQMGEHDNAVKQFKTYLSRNPNSPHRKKIEAYFRTREKQ